MSNKLLHTESAARYKHHIIRVEIGMVLHRKKVDDGDIELILFVINLPLVSNFNKISKYEADVDP
jgi:hypothetical protein